MPLGVTVSSSTAPPSAGRPVETATLFAAGEVAAANATAEAIEVRSPNDVAAAIGPRAGLNIPLFDYLDNFFREGGQRGFVAGFAGAADPDEASTYTEALGQFVKDLGPGQAAIVGVPTDAALVAAVGDHAQQNNRFGMISGLVDDTDAEMEAIGGLLRADDMVEYMAFFGDWINVPAPVGTIGGASRQVPLASTVAGLIQRSDFLGNVNRAAAGRDFPFQYGTSLVRTHSDDEREALLNAGVNTAAVKYGILQNYGFQTAMPETPDSPFWQANCARARMWLKARSEFVAEPFVFKTIDGKGILAGNLKSDIEVVCSELYEAGGLYGERPQDAYSVSVDPSINQEASVAQGRLNVGAQARFSLHAKEVHVDLVSVPVTGRIAI